MRIAAVVGARPQFIKAAPILEALSKKVTKAKLIVIHSGQHYDFEMSRLILDDLGFREPTETFVLHRSGHSARFSEMLLKIERSLGRMSPEVVIVFGDTDTTLAGALAASKLKIPVSHVEAGVRSFDLKMPEEINRRLVDHCSQLLFAPTKTAMKNLSKEGITKPRSVLTGDVMVDSLIRMLPKLRKEQKKIFDWCGLEARKYAILTLHRQGNVDNPQRLKQILEAVAKLSRSFRFVFPVHPHTMKSILGYHLRGITKGYPNFTLTRALGYTSFLALLAGAAYVLTDSGGVQKEAYLLRTPCITLRDESEWPETLCTGGNVLVGANSELIKKYAGRAEISNLKTLGREREVRRLSPFGDGKASLRIAKLVSDLILQHEKQAE